MSYPIINISAYKPKWSDKRKENVPGSVPFDTDFYKEMYRTRDGYYKEIIEKLRSIEDYQESNDFKAQYLISLTISCTTKDWRRKENIVSRSGLMNIDLDGKDNPDVEDWGALRDELFSLSPFIVSSWLSARGGGLTFVIKVDHEKFRETFETVKNDLLERGLKLDKGLHDEVRLRFVSWDPEIKIRENFDEIPVYQAREPKVEKAPTIDFVPSTEIDSVENFEACLARAEKDYLFQDGQKHMYLSKMAGMANTIGMSQEYVEFLVMDKFLEKSGLAPDELLKPVRNIYRSYKEQHGQLKKAPEKSDKMKAILVEAHRLNRQGIKPGPDTIDMLAEQQEMNIDEVERIFEKVFKENKEDFGIEEKPEIIKVQSYLNKKYDFAKNIVTQRAEYKKKGTTDWEQISADEIYKELQETGFKFDLNKVKSLLRTTFVQPYDPFKQYFDGLPQWNGKEDFIGQLAGHIQTDDQDFYVTQFRKALVRSIACTLDNKENRIVFTFVGEKQETGKSTFLRFLNPWGAKKYYTESPLRDGKDTEFRFSENFIYNLEELSSLNNIEINRLKAIISKSSIKERKPFATDEEEHPRRCNFWGSTNKAEFLTDTENTRWLCFVVQKIRWDYRETINIHNVWAQAYTLYKSGFDYQLTRDEMQRRDTRNKEFEVVTSERELIQKYYIPVSEKEQYSQYMTMTEIVEDLVEKTSNRIKINSNVLGKVMTQLGFERAQRKINNKSVRGYWIKRNYDINSQGAKYDQEPVVELPKDDLPF